jgi:hypothetical protein
VNCHNREEQEECEFLKILFTDLMRENERLKTLLEKRDEFIVSKCLWSEFESKTTNKQSDAFAGDGKPIQAKTDE